MIKFISNKGHLYFAAAQHTSNVLQISGEFPVLWVYLPKVDVWNLLSQAPLQLGPKGVIEALSNHRKGFKLKEKNGKRKASHGIHFGEGGDVRQRYIQFSEVTGADIQECVPIIVMTISKGNCS